MTHHSHLSPSESSHPMIAVVGPTGSGKTALGVYLAKALQTEVVSADSQLVYRGLDIGTAKPTKVEQEGIPHHMIDLVKPDQAYTVAQYRHKAQPLCRQLAEAGKTPVIVGGTGFYVKALLPQPEFPDIPPLPEFRKKLSELAHTHGPAHLHRILTQKDPRRAAELHPNDQFRLIRALEIIEATGQPVPSSPPLDLSHIIWVGLSYEDRDLMRKRIDQRIDAMITSGWLEEVQNLIERYGPQAHALQVAHGYPELVQHLAGERTLEEALGQIQINIHQYARRQMTWYRQKLFQQGDQGLFRWFSVDKIPFTKLCDQALEYVKKSWAS